jgi:hypothetical protein
MSHPCACNYAGTCELCLLSQRDPRYRALWTRVPLPTTDCEDCAHLGRQLGGHEREMLGLSHSRDWFVCAAGRGPVCRCEFSRQCNRFAQSTDS